MNKEEIDKWLNNEYGVSYTRLEELHDFLIEQNMKYQDKIVNLHQENKQLKETINKVKEYCKREIGNIIANYDYVDTKDLENILEILGDKENEET